jgi:pimeloyl-ACP methyl ester carboxylesterase
MVAAKSRDRPIDGQVRVRRAYFDCRFGQLNVRTAFPASGGFDERTTLLCVHSERTSSRQFARWLATIANDRSVYAPDLPGCGESDAPLQPPSIADYAAALADFASGMHFRQLDVLGSGVGALIAAELALAAPQMVRCLVFVAAGGTDAEAHASARTPVEGEADLLHNGPAAQWVAAAVREYRAAERLALLKQPALILSCRDEPAEAAPARQLLRSARSAEVEHRSADLFGAAGHLVTQRLREFLDGR